jgi:hypothetical protein
MVAQQQRACVRGKTERQVDQNDGRFRTTGRIPKDAAAFAAVSEYMPTSCPPRSLATSIFFFLFRCPSLVRRGRAYVSVSTGEKKTIGPDL